MSNRTRTYLVTTAQYALLALVLVLLIFPVYWMGITSFKTQDEVYMLPQSYWPQHFTLEGYPHLFRQLKFGLTLMNSVIVAGCAALGSTIMGGLAAYGLNRFELPGRGLLFAVLVVSIALPGMTTVGPIFLAYQGLGLYDTKIGLILVNLSFGLSFAIYFLFAYFQTIPRELDDAAHIDGCTWLGIFWYVILPIARPAVVTTFLIGYIGVWNEYLLANILTASENAKTLTVRLLEIAPAARIEPYQLYAVGGILSLIPVILIVMLGQRHIVGGIVRGAVKG